MSDSLIDWMKERLASLYQQDPTSPEVDVAGILKSTFKPDARVVYNHQPIDLAKFGEGIQKSSFAATRADIEWKDIIAVPIKGDEENPKVWISRKLLSSTKFKPSRRQASLPGLSLSPTR